MPIQTIYVVRHADRAWDLKKVGKSTPTGILGDVALTRHGEKQTRELDWFFSQPFSDDSRPIPDRIYSSVYWRTLQTIYNIPCGTDRIYAEPGLGERVLDDGYHPPIALSQTHLRTFPAIDPDAHEPVLLPPPVHETRRDLIQRMEVVMDRLIERIELEDPLCETILLGTHASPALCIAKALLGEDAAREIHTYTAGVTKYRRRHQSERLSAWRLDWNCRVDYLSGGGEMDWSWDKDRANLYGGVSSAASTPPPESRRPPSTVHHAAYTGSARI